MHNWRFLKIIEEFSNYKLLPYGVYRNDDLICILPLFLKRIFFIKLLFSPPPRMCLPYLGFVLKNDYFNLRADQKESYLKTIFEDINEEINKINPNYLLITSTHYLKDFRIFKWNNYNLDINHTYILDLSKSKEQILKEMKNRRRQKINKAKRENIEIYEINEPDFLFESLNQNYSEQKMNSPIIDKNYLNELKKTYPDNIIFRIAEHNGKKIGSEGLMNYHDLHLNWLGGSKLHTKLPVNEFLIWDYIEKAKDNGLKKFDFVGANNEHISFFKSQFGPELTHYYTLLKTNFIGKILENIYFNFIKRSLL
jgi:predicted N-acyltransferase